MNQEMAWFVKERVKRTIENLKKNNIDAIYFENRQSAKTEIIASIRTTSSIAFGGSVTVRDIGLLDELRNGGYKLFDRFAPSITKDEKWEIQRQGLLADVFITGSNAITTQGEILNIDHSGNRVAAMLYGPNKVYIIIGINKIVEDLEEGLRRVRKMAAPLNAKRGENEYHPPCLELGKCIDCDSNERICNSLVIIKRQYRTNRITVVIIGEELGF
jgi:hypothetical protein